MVPVCRYPKVDRASRTSDTVVPTPSPNAGYPYYEPGLTSAVPVRSPSDSGALYLPQAGTNGQHAGQQAPGMPLYPPQAQQMPRTRTHSAETEMTVPPAATMDMQHAQSTHTSPYNPDSTMPPAASAVAGAKDLNVAPLPNAAWQPGPADPEAGLPQANVFYASYPGDASSQKPGNASYYPPDK